jgi:diacylglycerol kinase (ATP)
MPSGLLRLLRATAYSFKGLRAAFANEEAFRQELLVALVATPLGYWLGSSAVERALLIGSWLLVLVVELINTAIEAVVDRSGLERDELAGLAKDAASAAVMCAVALALVVWALILLDG